MYIQMDERYGAALFGGAIMLTNADCTIYEKGTYVRHVIKDIYWNDSRGMTVQKNGAQISDSVTVYIYDSDYVPKSDDIITRGAVDFEFDGSSQQTVSASMKQFRELCPEFAVVRSVNNCRYGGLHHIEVIAR